LLQRSCCHSVLWNQPWNITCHTRLCFCKQLGNIRLFLAAPEPEVLVRKLWGKFMCRLQWFALPGSWHQVQIRWHLSIDTWLVSMSLVPFFLGVVCIANKCWVQAFLQRFALLMGYFCILHSFCTFLWLAWLQPLRKESSHEIIKQEGDHRQKITFHISAIDNWHIFGVRVGTFLRII
jgi:hypothetical protein